MAEIALHIVSFAIPDPPDYGGIIDVFYKIKCLSEAGVSIYLHCSQYDGRQPSPILESWCKKVWYYPRKTGLQGLSWKYPYMVYSRRDEQLLLRLQQIDAPIFFDGLSTSYYASHPSLASRLKILRPQNVEQDYYRLLAKRTPHFFKKTYYTVEAMLLARMERKLGMMQAFFTVAQHDFDFFKVQYPLAAHEYMPSFQPYHQVTSLTGIGEYCLYHGNLSVAENEEAALFLLEQVFSKTTMKIVLAGKKPSAKIIQAAAALPNCQLIANPDSSTMQQLIAKAQVHVLPTFQSTGLKLKLLHALYQGRHVLVNTAMLTGTGLASICHIANDAPDFIAQINNLMQQPFDLPEREKRQQVLQQHYDNATNIQKLVRYLEQHRP